MNALEGAGFIALGLVAGTYGSLVGVGGVYAVHRWLKPMPTKAG